MTSNKQQNPSLRRGFCNQHTADSRHIGVQHGSPGKIVRPRRGRIYIANGIFINIRLRRSRTRKKSIKKEMPINMENIEKKNYFENKFVLYLFSPLSLSQIKNKMTLHNLYFFFPFYPGSYTGHRWGSSM